MVSYAAAKDVHCHFACVVSKQLRVLFQREPRQVFRGESGADRFFILEPTFS
jgi:hypothetical protein